ncbi:ATP-grasp domain-containing protein [Winogradskya consettensis]|uniref:ATP-grasp domain-containing protein n=1 Tax=Winogradskya consettensis TaxID=113560 RepID=UPI001FCFCE05|nr:hypothetical protein [Actinoplanes consettensis]
MAYLGLLTTDDVALHGRDVDTAALVDALRGDGLRVDAPVWHDESVDWGAYDLLVIRSPWDYSERFAEFMAWLDRAAGLTRILNAPELIRWNIDKKYLRDLEGHGLPCVPTVFCETVEEAEVAVSRSGQDRIVVKPSISAGSRDTGLFAPGDPEAIELAGRILAAGKTVMVQPANEHVIEHGENGLFFLNGTYAYAFHKGPILAPGGVYVGGEYGPAITATEATPAEIALGERALEAVRKSGFDLPLYARIDIAAGTEVIEVEVFEPAYQSDTVPEAVGLVAQAIRDRIRGL